MTALNRLTLRSGSLSVWAPFAVRSTEGKSSVRFLVSLAVSAMLGFIPCSSGTCDLHRFAGTVSAVLTTYPHVRFTTDVFSKKPCMLLRFVIVLFTY